MKKLKRYLAALLALCLCLPGLALGETALIPQLAQWQLEDSELPIRTTMGVELSALTPLDDDRVAALNLLLSHLSFRAESLTTGAERWSRSSVLVDGAETLSLTRREVDGVQQLNASFLPDVTLQSEAVNPVTLLLGESPTLALGGYPADAEAILREVRRLTDDLPVLLAQWMTEDDISKKLEKYGTAKRLYTYTLPAEDAAALGEVLAGAAQEERVRAFLSGLTFTKEQEITVYADAEGQPLRLSYTGRCGTDEEHQRKVSLTWSMKDDGTTARDSLTLKSPAVSGKDRDTLTWKRLLSAKDGERTLDASFRCESVRDGETTVLEGEADLTHTFEVGNSRLTGKAWIEQTDAQERRSTWIAEPELLLSLEDMYPEVSGTVRATCKQDKKITLDAVLTCTLAVGEGFNWEMRAGQTDLEGLSAEALALLQAQGAENMASQLVQVLLRLPAEDLTFLRDGLTDEAWQRIINALGSA